MLNGIDVLERGGFFLLAGSRVGLVTNHTGIAVDGRATADILHREPSVDLRALFGPEHGIRGELDENIPDATDPSTGLPVYSLFGDRKEPSEEQLAGIDTLVFDIQDIGCRFYTYISTLGGILEAASRYGQRVVVLDRPNPVTGGHVEGPLVEPYRLSFTAYHSIPVRHGMTVGELARLMHAERAFACELKVVACEGWKRAQWFDATGLFWVDPSPNMRSLTEATLYPGVGLLEMTNVSVGRGADTPFEMVGAPYVDARPFARSLNDAALPGVRFVPRAFTPRASVFAGQRCDGVHLIVTDRESFDSVRTGLTIAAALRRLYPTEWQHERLLNLLANREVYSFLADGRGYDSMASVWQKQLSEFAARCERVKLYE